MGKLIYVPLEVIPSRYTGIALEAMKKVADIIVSPDLSVAPPKAGQFLNFAGSCQFKAHQLVQIAQLFLDSKVQDGDAFLFADLWFPGLEMVRYIADSVGVEIKIGAINHAGRADPTDFINSFGSWADHVEHALHRCCDYIFVGSEFHRAQVLEYLADNAYFSKKVVVTGQPIHWEYVFEMLALAGEELGDPPRNGPIVWPHRPSEEKGIADFRQLATAAPHINFAVLSGVALSNNYYANSVAGLPNVKILDNLPKHHYYWHLLNAKGWLSTAQQETFGYSLHEAMMLGIPIIAPHRACYPEISEKTEAFTCYTSLIDCIKRCEAPGPDIQSCSNWVKNLSQVGERQRYYLCG